MILSKHKVEEMGIWLCALSVVDNCWEPTVWDALSLYGTEVHFVCADRERLVCLKYTLLTVTMKMFCQTNKTSCVATAQEDVKVTVLIGVHADIIKADL